VRHLVRTTKALADETRIRIIGALQGRELCVCQLIELLGLAPSTVSKHLSILRNARLIEGRKQGRWMYYRLADPDAPGPILAAIDWVIDSFSASSQFAPDRERLKEILNIDPEILCGRQPNPDA
jgi:ArsR family transcriptional regulator, arsenate/arsenite/antimonite-responsive transcriptional repressor